MAVKKEFSVQSGQGDPEQVRVITLSELLEELLADGKLTVDGNEFELDEASDLLVIGIPDTGTAKFVPSGETKPDKDGKTKATKACFIVAEAGGFQAGEGIDYRQSKGDVALLPMTLRMSLIAQVPNNKGKTIDEALNRKPTIAEVPQTTEKAA